MSSESTVKILEYFKDLLQLNKLSSLKDDAVNRLIEVCGGFVDSIDREKGIVKYRKTFYDEKTDGPIEGLVTYDFYKEHKIELYKKSKTIIECIDVLVCFKTEGNEPYMSMLNNINQEIHYLNLKAAKTYPEYKELFLSLKTIENHLFERYQIKPFVRKQVDEKFSYFGVKDGIKPSLIEQLFWVAEKHQIVDYDITDKDTFINVLLYNPSDADCIIRFNCFSYLAIIFLERISPLFNSFEPINIGNSKRFYLKGGDLLQSDNYYTLKSRAKNKTNTKIDTIISDLDDILNQ